MSNFPCFSALRLKRFQFLLILLFCVFYSLSPVYGQIIAKNNFTNPVWSDPNSWIGGVVPNFDDKVVIPEGVGIRIDVDFVVINITVHGTLGADLNKDLKIVTNYILVDGESARFRWGTQENPYRRTAVITLAGKDPAVDILGLGNNFIGAINGGQIDIHGVPHEVSWTQLARTAEAGSRKIQVIDNTDWRVGDQIVIASSDFSAHQAEVRTIKDIRNGGTLLMFDLPLDTAHYGRLQYYKGGSLELDERTEVGLLTHNIRIQGENPGPTGYGGHIIIRGGTSKGRISGVELYQMGQKSMLGRYPFHWHHAMDASGQYFKNSSVHHSFNRVVTIHHTDNALVRDIVAYDHIGHGFFLESGSERGNRLIHNLGILTRRPIAGEEVQLHDRAIDPGDLTILLPATFWITNPDNTFVGNAAAGSEGSGFWFTAQRSVIDETDGTGLVPGRLPIRIFNQNRAHSNVFANLAIDGNVYWTDLNGDGEISVREESFEFNEYHPVHAPGSDIVIRQFISYKCSNRSIWTRASTLYFNHCQLADSHLNTFFAFNQILKNSLIVGQSNNFGMRTRNQVDTSIPFSVPVEYLSHLDRRNFLFGHTLYDGPSGLDNVHFAGFDKEYTTGISISGAARKSPVHWSNRISWEPGTLPEAKINMNFVTRLDHEFSSGLVDIDGTMTGIPLSRIVPKIQWYVDDVVDPMAVMDTSYNVEFEDMDVMVPEWEAAITRDLDIGTMFMEPDWGSEPYSEVYAIRYKGLPLIFNQPSYPTLLYDPGRGDSQMQPSVYTNNSISDRTEMFIWQFHRIPYNMRFYLQWAKLNQQMISAIPGVPYNIQLTYEDGSAVPLAPNMDALTNSLTETYFVRDNILYIHHKATIPFDKVDIHGLGNTYRSKTMVMCLPSFCGTGGATSSVTLADFQLGNYTRSSLQGFGIPTPALYVSADDPTFCAKPEAICDQYIEYEIVSDGDGIDEYLTYRLQLYDQPWTHFGSLEVTINAPAVHVVFYDRSEGPVDLGRFIPSGGNLSISLVDLPKTYCDEIYRLEFRIYESDLGDLNTAGLTGTVSLYNIGLMRGAHVTGMTSALRRGIESASGASSILTENDLIIYPNPSNDHLTLTFADIQPGPIEVRFYTLDGRLVKKWTEETSKGNWKHTFDLSQLELTKGIYLVILQSVSSQNTGLMVVK